MQNFKREIKLKTKIQNAYDLSLIYTPGVGNACLEIKENIDNSYIYTNKANSIAIIAAAKNDNDCEHLIPFLERQACIYKEVSELDAYYFVIKYKDKSDIINAIIALSPNFCGFDFSNLMDNIDFSSIELPYITDFKEILNKNIINDFLKPLILKGLTERQPLKDLIKQVKELTVKDFNSLIEQKINKKFSCRNYKNLEFKEASLRLRKDLKGVIETQNSSKINNFKDLNLIYSETKAKDIAEKIKSNLQKAYEYTNKGNTIAIISDGSAVLGLGNIGAAAGLPVMEGKAALFKTLGNVDAVPLCLNTQNPDKVIEIIQRISPVFGGVNLEDIGAPNCFKVENELIKRLDIPVFHDDQHGTAIIVLAGLINSLKLAQKTLNSIKIVISGAGAAGLAITNLLIKYGAKNIILTDKYGIAYPERKEEMYPYKQNIVSMLNPEKIKGDLKEAIKGADVFIGVSAPNILTADLIKTMTKNPIIFALANPTPEIMPEIAKKAGAFIVATGRSDFNNQINNSLAFPGLFRGVLDAKIKNITDEMKIATSQAIASIIPDENLSCDYIIPNALDMSVPNAVAKAIKGF